MSTEADLAETASLVERFDRRIVTQVADVRDRGPLAAAVAAGVAALGHLDVVVANAGIIPLGSDVPPVAFLDTVSVDLVGVINTVEAAFPHLPARPGAPGTGRRRARLRPHAQAPGQYPRPGRHQ
jgi:NAD(P)-dependent dehydrogenase (short-subunit alcohol dehydrogenase family)